MQCAAEAAGGTVADIAKWTILTTDADNVGSGIAAFPDFWDPAKRTASDHREVVSGLADPAFLIEIEAIAAIQR